MQEMLDVVMDYVDRILEEKIPPNKEIGRHLLSLAHSIPKMSPEEFEEMLNTNVKVCFFNWYISQAPSPTP